jgi:hypothetical protein
MTSLFSHSSLGALVSLKHVAKAVAVHIREENLKMDEREREDVDCNQLEQDWLLWKQG